MMSEDLSIDARQETRIVCTEMKLKRAEEKIGDLEDRVRLLEKRVFQAAAGFINGVPYSIIKVETPIKLVPDKPKIDPVSGKEIDPQSGRLT